MLRTIQALNPAVPVAAMLFLLATCGSAVALPVMIDDFSSPDPALAYFVGLLHPNSTPIEQPAPGHAIGDERDVLVEVLGTPNVQSAQVLIGVDASLFPNGVFQAATATDPGSKFTLQYDGMDVDGPQLTNAHALSADLSAGGNNTALVIDLEYVSVDSPGAPGLDLDIMMTSPGGGTASYSALVPEAASLQHHVIQFSGFTTSGGFTFANVDSIEFVFNRSGLANVDFEIDNLTAIPEPASCVLLALALAGLPMLMSRRRSMAV